MPEERRSQIIGRVGQAGGRLRVRSALNPVLWLCGIVTVPCLVLTTYIEEPSWLIVIFVVIASAPIALTALGFCVLLFFDRDKLQSEEFQIMKRTLEMIEEKGNGRTLQQRPMEVIANPEKLADGGKDGEAS